MTGTPRTDLEGYGWSHPAEDSWIIHLPFAKNPMPMNGSRGHWSTHAKKSRQMRGIAYRRLIVAEVPAMAKCEVQLVWWVGTATRRDPANLAAFEKPLFDAVVDAGVVPDDNPQYMNTPRATIRPVRDGTAFVTEPGFTLHIRRIDTADEFEIDR